jgi:hypothetical protein
MSGSKSRTQFQMDRALCLLRNVATLWDHPLINLVFNTVNTGYTQKNGAVSKVNKKFVSHLTWAQPTPSAAATVQVSHALTFWHRNLTFKF